MEILCGYMFTLDQQSVEKIQRRATKRLVGEIKDLPYADRLRYLNLPSLRYRRLYIRGDLIYTYKLTHNLLDVDPVSLFTFQSSSTTRGHCYKIYKPRATSLQRRQFFSLRVINGWNSLQEDIVNTDSIDLFKTYVDRFYYDYQYNIV